MSGLILSRAEAEAATEKLRIYAQPQRLMILNCLLQGEKTVGEIESITGIGQPALSQQLAELRRADRVKTRRAAKQIYYALANEHTALCVRTIEALFSPHEQSATALHQPANALREVLQVHSLEQAHPHKKLLPPPTHHGAAAFVRIW
jgi:DNA-binding transcriptional ArsR family regulator